ncbi:MAG TPA: MAPEG family protein [Steroidobacteraceae bacterium]|jgi:glutathione S-transferase|nr:MAPEG family protein [Steroidobacteraceae bacterium]
MHSLVTLVTLLALALFFWMGANVARARMRCGVPAPAVTGHPEFERHFRVQANTVEGLIIFLPSLWLFALTIDGLASSDLGDKIAAALGLLWIIGRVIYMQSYVRNPASRGLGFGIQSLASVALLIGGLAAVVWNLGKTGL